MNPELQIALYAMSDNEKYFSPILGYGMLSIASLLESRREAINRVKELKQLPHNFVIKGPRNISDNIFNFQAERDRNGYQFAGVDDLSQVYIHNLLLFMEKKLLIKVNCLPENAHDHLALESFQIRAEDYKRKGATIEAAKPYAFLKVSRPFTEEIQGALLYDAPDPYENWSINGEGLATRGYKLSSDQVLEMTGCEIRLMPESDPKLV